MKLLRCAVYARYSTDRQSQTSIEDQVRKCRQYACKEGWVVLDNHIYSDEAVSGTGSDRAGLKRMLDAALRPDHEFEVLLIDDTSRLSRNLPEAAGITERLKYFGVRLVAVSQGLDSENEQADVLTFFHGLVDSIYVKELAKKTHRGLEGRALKGFHTGGRCFGYQNLRVPQGVTLEIQEPEAKTVRRIFELYANGKAFKKIAKLLNAERVPTPRPRAKKRYSTWCPTAIREMLRRELYIGRIVWNKRMWVKVPGTNRRRYRARPETQWLVFERPELRVVSDELWRRVQYQLEDRRKIYGRGKVSRAASSPYLLSGLIKCGSCGADMVIVSGRGQRNRPKYGCPQHHYRGACNNGLMEHRDRLERKLLAGLQDAVLQPAAIDYAVEAFGQQMKAVVKTSYTQVSALRERERELDVELRNLTEAIAAIGNSMALRKAIEERERDLGVVKEQLEHSEPGTVDTAIDDMRRFVTEGLFNVCELLNENVVVAKAKLRAHVDKIRLCPEEKNGERYYVAEGEWNLSGESGEVGRTRTPSEMRVRMVAGAGFEPATSGL